MMNKSGRPILYTISFIHISEPDTVRYLKHFNLYGYESSEKKEDAGMFPTSEVALFMGYFLSPAMKVTVYNRTV